MGPSEERDIYRQTETLILQHVNGKEMLLKSAGKMIPVNKRVECGCG